MPRLLKDLQINDVSSVDRGAGRGVKVLLMKRDDESATDNVIDMRGLIGKTKFAAPEVLNKEAVDFDTAQENKEVAEDARGFMDEVQEAICALNCSVCSILCDDDVADKAAAIGESFDQFKSYIAGLSPENMEKAMNAEVKKAIDEAVSVALKDTAELLTKAQAEVAKLQDENAMLKLSADEQEFIKAMSPEDKKKFAEKAKADREKDMEKAKKAAESTLDPEIKKRLDRAEANEALLKSLVDKDERASFAKRATDIGLSADDGEMLRKAAKGDDASFSALEKRIGELNKALHASQKAGGIFKEFGSANSQSGSSAIDALNAKAAELRKADPKLSEAQAFAKAYNDPANKDLAAQEKQERNKAIGAAA